MRKAKPQNPYTYSLVNAKVPFLAPDVLPKVIPSPVDGWDAISPLAEMDPKRAPILQNWVPRPGFVELRGGYIPWGSTGTTNPVETLLVFRSPTLEKMFAAAGSKIYDASSSGGIFSVAVSGTSSSRWQYVNFTPNGGTTVLQCVNGADLLRQFDGSTWTQPSITGLPVGITTASFINIHAQKQRLWYVVQNSTIVCYMPIGAITGPIAGTLDFGSLWSLGGHIVAMADWTIDGGFGPQDYVAFISSRGQVALFSGTDPTNSSAWSLVGIFTMAPPISFRCASSIGSDVSIITLQGVVPISQVLPFDPSADRSVAITARIQNAMAQATAAAQNNFGWQVITFPAQQLLIINVPFTENSSQQQYVMNTLTGAWCNFTGWNANNFVIYNDNLYWGGNAGQVNQGYVGSADFVSSIAGDMQCAFNWFDEPGRIKRMTMIQPLLNMGGTLTPSLAVDEDFNTSTATTTISSFGGGVQWDKAVWDTSLWPTQQITYKNWLSVQAIGHALAVHMRVNFTGVTSALGLFDSAQFDQSDFDEGLSPSLPILQINAFNSILELGGAI